MNPIIQEAINGLQNDVMCMYDRYDPDQIKDWIDFHTLEFSTTDRKIIQDSVFRYVSID